jgi:hypothetical protein
MVEQVAASVVKQFAKPDKRGLSLPAEITPERTLQREATDLSWFCCQGVREAMTQWCAGNPNCHASAVTSIQDVWALGSYGQGGVDLLPDLLVKDVDVAFGAGNCQE